MSILSDFESLPHGAEWTGTRCGHTGRKGFDFYAYNPYQCRSCYNLVTRERKRLEAAEQRKYETSPASQRSSKVFVNFIGKKQVLDALRSNAAKNKHTVQAEMIAVLRKAYGI